MRAIRDRIRHAVIFEALALVIVATVGRWAAGFPVEKMGAISSMFSSLVLGWYMLHE